MTVQVPTHWYNILADLGLHLPAARPAPSRESAASEGMSIAIPKALVRQNMPLQTWVAIPEPVREAYREWRPTPLLRLRRLEKDLGTSARLYMKYEAGNVAGSHKYITALAQAHYYAEAGVRTLVTSTAAAQWGTAISAAANRFGLGCVIYVVPGSYDRKPGRRAVMELLGAEVLRGREAGAGRETSLSDVMSQAIERAAGTDGARWILGGSEPFAILHSTVIGMETRDQLAEAGETEPPVLIGYLGGGKNVGGLGLPFLTDDGQAEIVTVESTAYPVLTRGEYRYDATDRAGRGDEAKMYTLGRGFKGAPIQAESMRYHAAPKLFSLLREKQMISPVAHDERDVFDSARRLLRTEGRLPSAEAAYAVHSACAQALRPENAGRPVVFCVSDHGYFDGDAYRAYLDGELAGSGVE